MRPCSQGDRVLRRQLTRTAGFCPNPRAQLGCPIACVTRDQSGRVRAGRSRPLGYLEVVAPSTARVQRRGGLGGRWQALPTVIRYGLAGGVTQAIYLTTMAVALWAGTYYLGALVLAQVAAITFAFPAYRNLVFVAQGSVLRQLGTFMGVWWTGAAMSLVGVPALVEIAGLPPLVAQVVVLTFVVLMSYLGHRTMTFSRSASHVPPGSSC